MKCDIVKFTFSHVNCNHYHDMRLNIILDFESLYRDVAYMLSFPVFFQENPCCEMAKVMDFG